MWGKNKTPWSFRATDDHPHRRGKRHVVDSLTCDLGVVLDLSAVGMRLGVTGKPPLQVGQSGKIKLRIPEGSLSVTGRIVWIRRKGVRKYEMGVEFVEVKRSVAAALDLLARFGFLAAGDVADAPEPNKKKQTVRASFALPDYYAVLGIGHNASADEIRDAFRGLARKLHPDVSNDPTSSDRFIQVNEAYEVLRDDKRRKQYDLKMAG